MTEAVAAVNRARLAWLSELRIYLDQTRGDCGKTNQETIQTVCVCFSFCLVMKTDVKISPSMTFASFFFNYALRDSPHAEQSGITRWDNRANFNISHIVHLSCLVCYIQPTS